jgi:hypothetical protein
MVTRRLFHPAKFLGEDKAQESECDDKQEPLGVGISAEMVKVRQLLRPKALSNLVSMESPV